MLNNMVLAGQGLTKDVRPAKGAYGMLVEYIESGDHGVFFDWRHPTIIKKTRKSEHPAAHVFPNAASGI